MWEKLQRAEYTVLSKTVSIALYLPQRGFPKSWHEVWAHFQVYQLSPAAMLQTNVQQAFTSISGWRSVTTGTTSGKCFCPALSLLTRWGHRCSVLHPSAGSLVCRPQRRKTLGKVGRSGGGLQWITWDRQGCGKWGTEVTSATPSMRCRPWRAGDHIWTVGKSETRSPGNILHLCSPYGDAMMGALQDLTENWSAPIPELSRLQRTRVSSLCCYRHCDWELRSKIREASDEVSWLQADGKEG